ncbi:hypothetical protein Patl1_03400 [Pistacia atlantica]|uniref:Uncharacterized protein n=1 Tax=Pistacia atlantica TaxID=434234 RepID=A0ACC1C963_9ROSI|nr:hypothetical protein Patl1_03400 [Pistacia atlantica]
MAGFVEDGELGYEEGFVEDGEVGFEEGLSWLPSHVLDEAFSDTHHHLQQSKTSPRPHQRPKIPSKWASRGSGMQAIFLESGQKSCGTGVFLPQRGGANFQPSRKPACSPVLLPSRVVQALNLNVHAIGLQISPRKDSKADNLKGGDCNNSVKNKSTGNDVSAKCGVTSQHQSSSPEIFLPKEWTY